MNHEQLLEKFEEAKEYFYEEYKRGEEDADFLFGNQWSEQDRNKRHNEGRPCLTENRLMPFADKVINDIRQARPSIKVSPADDEADPETAEILKGIIRNIEKVSGADNVYDTAAENAIQSAYGWIRVVIDYSDYESFDQEIKLKRIRNPRSVYIDPNFEEMDAADAEHVYIYEDIPLAEFEKRYPKAEAIDFSTDWGSEKSGKKFVRLAECYYKEYTKKKIVKGLDGQIYDAKDYDGEILLEREVEVCQVKYAKLSGSETLEVEDWPGKYLPIIPVFGKEGWVDNKRQSFSLINQAKDPQRNLNYWISASTEVLALQPKAPFQALKGQIKSDRAKYATANRDNHAVLEHDPVKLPDGTYYVAPPQRTAPPQGSMAMFQHMASAADGIRNVLGMYAASLGDSGPELAGVAIQERRMGSDESNFHFMDNLSTAMRHTGRVMIDLIPKVYSGNRIMRIIGDDGNESLVPVNQPFATQGGVKRPVNPLEQAMEGIYRLDVGKYDVAVEVGPSYATKRKEFVDSAIQMMAQDPEFARVSRDLVVKNMDFPNAEEISKRLQMLLPPEMQGEDPEQEKLAMAGEALKQMEAQLMEMTQALQNKDADEKLKREIELAKIDIDRQKVMIDAAKAQAEIEQKIPAEAFNEIVTALQDMDTRINDASDALELILDDPPDLPTENEPTSEAQMNEPPSGGFFNRIFGR